MAMTSRAVHALPFESPAQLLPRSLRRPAAYECVFCRHRKFPGRQCFSSSASPRQADKGPFRSRLRTALRNTKIEWKPIPIGLGIAFLGGIQFHRVQAREREKVRREEEEEAVEDGSWRARKRKRIRPDGPWTVRFMSYLPLKGISRIWGWFNELTIPYHLRVPGFKLYSWIFGVNLSEVSDPDLHVYPNLASFFYRTLRPGVRPLDPNLSAVLSPADGRVLQYGMIEHGEVEQVKGMTYSLEALLGSASPTFDGPPDDIQTSLTKHGEDGVTEDHILASEEEFAKVNGISYYLPNWMSKGNVQKPQKGTGPQASETAPETMDASTKAKSSSIAEVRADLALGDGSKWWFFSQTPKTPTALYYIVIYLAPGDYHRFHSPTSWVAEKRRHFAGELYSVSPYLQRTLPGLFTLNERVVLLGRWRWGFFSFTPVGATNVGSIRVNFDSELRTNSLRTDTAADRAAERAAQRGEPYCGFAEATYSQASTVLGGHALRRGEEMGGFQLGSSIVLVFEAPKGRRKSFDEGWKGGEVSGGWKWAVQKGQKVQVGEAIGQVVEEGI